MREGSRATPRFRFLGNVAYGCHLDLKELGPHDHAICFATGAQSDRRMGIPGEDLEGSYAPTEFVAGYKGHRDLRDRVFDLSVQRVAVVRGNVAVEVARTLCRTPVAARGPPAGKPRRLVLRFRVSPAEISGDERGDVRGIRIVPHRLVGGEVGRIVAKPTGEHEQLEVGMALRSVGHRRVTLPGVSFDERRAVVPNHQGRVLDPETPRPRPSGALPLPLPPSRARPTRRGTPARSQGWANVYPRTSPEGCSSEQLRRIPP